MGTVSLQKIIDMVLEEAHNTSVDDLEKDKRNLYRKFERLIEKLGADKETVKKGGRNYEFRETDVPFMKVLLSQLYSNQGIVAEFVNRKKRNEPFSSKEVWDLINALLDTAEEDGANKEQLMAMAEFFAVIFCYSPLRSIEQCYKYIGMLAVNLRDLTFSEQAIYLNRVEHILKKEVASRLAESVFRCVDIAELLQMGGVSDVADYYNTLPPEVAYEYFERDRAVLERIQEDDDLRKYIENKLGEKAEEIFGHVASE